MPLIVPLISLFWKSGEVYHGSRNTRALKFFDCSKKCALSVLPLIIEGAWQEILSKYTTEKFCC
ncbi:uncharacterized protein METZ01_LOCUS210467 [marine metagenome]|uniref:Uncharacterized protein n=1 Tax=marine metagenome TaxID=408172 RepID=A0A382F5Y5_9ZZZZ